MAKIKVVSDDGRVEARVYDAEADSGGDGEPYWGYHCGRCFGYGSDRGHFADTMESAGIHVDRCGQ